MTTFISYTKPEEYNVLFEKYIEAIKRDQLPLYISEIKCETQNEADSDESGGEDYNDEESESILKSQYYERKSKKPDKGRANTLKSSILSMDGLNGEKELDEPKFSSVAYCVDSTFIMSKLSLRRRGVLMAYPGAVVLPLREPVFTKKGDVTTNICDFNSLYPNTMRVYNICKTTSALNPRYAVYIDGQLHDPLNKSKFWVMCAPFELNKQYFNVCVILAKASFKQSALTSFISDIIEKRKQVKKLQKIALANNDLVEYLRFEEVQLKLKLFINTTYGAMFMPSFTVFQPYLCSLVTYGGRLALLRFFLTIYYYYAKKGICTQDCQRGPIAGDTDSLFIKSTKTEIGEILDMFHAWPSNRGIYVIEHEKTVDDIIFLARKRYIFYFRETQTLVSKGTFVKKQSEGCKVFLYHFLGLIFRTYLIANDIAGFKLRLKDLLCELKLECEKTMSHMFTLSKDLHEYKQPSCLHIQLKHLETITGKSYSAGAIIRYSHYPFVFIPGPFYGPLDVTNRAQRSFVKTKHNATALVEDFEELYKGANLKKSVVRGVELDLKAILNSIFTGIGNMQRSTTIQDLFNLEFVEVFGAGLFDSIGADLAVKRKRELDEQMSKRLRACNTALQRILQRK